MKLLRRIHLLVGCLFAPLLFYFTLSGAWQLMGWQDAERGEPKYVFHELSNPHLNQALPGAKRSASSAAFTYFAVAMCLGFCVTAGMGIVLAYRFFRPAWVVSLILALGIFLPLAFLVLAAHGKAG